MHSAVFGPSRYSNLTIVKLAFKLDLQLLDYAVLHASVEILSQDLLGLLHTHSFLHHLHRHLLH